MTLTTHIRASLVVLMVAALAFASVAGQVVTRLIAKALGDSASVRVAPVSSCAITEGGAHFTGCSSIL